MTPITFKTVYLSLALLALPQVLAGPAHARRHHGHVGHYGGFNWWGSGSYSSPCSTDMTSTSGPASVPTSSPPADGIIPTPPVSSPADSPSSSPPPPPATTPTPSPPVMSPSPTPSSAPPPAQTPVNSVVDSSSSVQDQILTLHNNYRALHGASALTWSDDLASYANNWSSGCAFKHSQGPYGENLAAGGGDGYSIPDLFKLWTDESSDYDPSNPTYSHFTQVVWKGSSQLGCAVVTCPADTVFPGVSAQYLTCEYNPPGNVIGEFADNVQV